MHLQFIDYLIMAIYVAFVIGIGFALKRYMRTSADFFLSGRSIPAWDMRTVVSFRQSRSS